MKVTQRIPTEMYAYMEFEKEYSNEEEAMIDHIKLINEYKGGVGLSTNVWAKARNNMLVTGEFDPNLFDQMNKAQRYFVNELKKALRANTEEDPTIN